MQPRDRRSLFALLARPTSSLAALSLAAIAAGSMGGSLAACSGDDSRAASDAGATGDDASAATDGTAGDDAGGGGGDSGADATPEPTCDGVPSTVTWEYVDPTTLPDFNGTGPGASTTARGLNGVAYGNGRFVAIGNIVGQARLLWLTSEDGVTWTQHEQALPGVQHGTLIRVHYIQGKFVFFGKDLGTGFRVYTSADGLTWDVHKIDDTGNVVENFVSDGTTTVMVGPSNSFYSTTDFVQWTPLAQVSGGSFGYDAIAVGAGHWVASINTSQSVYSSTNTTTWTPQDGVAHDLRVVFGRGMFVGNSGDGLFTSPDGTSFTKQTPTGLVNGGAPYFAGGRFMFLSALLQPPYTDQKIDVSTDGVTYSEFGQIKGHPAPNLWDIAFGKCRYVVAGFSQSGDTYKPWIISAAAAPAK